MINYGRMKKIDCPLTVAAIEASGISQAKLLELAHPLSYQMLRIRMREKRFERHVLLNILNGIEAHCMATAQQITRMKYAIEHYKFEVA